VRAAVAGLVALALALGACKGERQAEPSGGSPETGDGEAAAPGERTAKAVGDWKPSCEKTLAGLAALAPERRAEAILAGCPVCETAPILLPREGMKRTATYLSELDAAVQSCGGFCGKLARTDFLRLMQHQLDAREPSARPWRKLAEACPAELGWRDNSRGFVGATWFLLERVARTAGPELAAQLAAAKAPIPLPAVAAEGKGLALPAPAGGARVVPGRLVVTVLAEGVMVGRLPWARLAAAGVIVDGDYPGPTMKDDEGVAALAAAEVALQEAAVVVVEAAGAPVTILAPRALPARRVAEVLRRLGRPARLAVQAPTKLPEYELVMALPATLAATPAEGAAQPLTVGAEATVDELAAQLAKLAAVPAVALVVSAKP
jgi:hypothetical protein